jgi:hypothetical protein
MSIGLGSEGPALDRRRSPLLRRALGAERGLSEPALSTVSEASGLSRKAVANA